LVLPEGGGRHTFAQNLRLCMCVVFVGFICVADGAVALDRAFCADINQIKRKQLTCARLSEHKTDSLFLMNK
jgi:hypothetical protein